MNLWIALISLVAFFVLCAPLLVRFRPRWVAAFNLTVTNRITGPFARWLPGYAMLAHVGRKSGKIYKTPVNVFRVPDGFLIALTYGPNSEWVKNVLANGGGELETRRVRYRISSPKVMHDPSRRQFPLFVGLVLRVIGADHFLRVASSIEAGGE